MSQLSELRAAGDQISESLGCKVRQIFAFLGWILRRMYPRDTVAHRVGGCDWQTTLSSN